MKLLKLHLIQLFLSFFIYGNSFSQDRLDIVSQSSNTLRPEQILSWSPEIRSPRRARALSTSPWYDILTLVDESGGNSNSPGFWLVSTSLEDAYYSPVLPDHSMDALLPADPAFQRPWPP